MLLLLVLVLAAGVLRRFGAPPAGIRTFVGKAVPPPVARHGARVAPSGAAVGARAPGPRGDAGVAEARGTPGAGSRKEPGRQPSAPGRVASSPPVVLDDRELRLFISGTVSLPILAGAARTPFVVASSDAGRAAEVLVAAVPDGSAAVSVLSGTVDVAARGRRVRVGAGTFTTLASGAPPALAEPLPPPPDLAAPSRDATFVFGTLPPRITFSWRPRAAADAFRFVLARDPGFRRILADERIVGDRVTQGGLEEGTYYWRVGAVRKGATGPPGEAARFDVARRTTPPGLAVRPATRIDGGDAWLVSGRAEPGAKVFVSGTPVAVTETGAFSCRLRRDSAPGAIVVEAVDPLGNAAYDRQWVY